MSDDLLYDCAVAYKNLMRHEFEIVLSIDKSIKEFTVVFESNQFKHLSGLEKLDDIDEFKEKKSAILLNKILKRKITIQDVYRSSLANKKINEHSPNNIEYYVVDRLRELTNLYNNLHNMTTNNLHIHLWKKDCSQDMRPNHSQISADYLFEFQNSVTQKSETETACAFFLETKDVNTKKLTNAVGVSIIPTDISYSNDGSISVERCLILSVTEIDKNNSRNPITLISTPKEVHEKAYSDSEIKSLGKKVKLDIKDLRKKRENFSKKGTPKLQSLYQVQLDTFKKGGKYTVEMLKQVLTSLTSQAESQKNPDLKRLIEQEIKFVQGEMAKHEQSQTSELSSGIKISKSVINNNGTMAINPTGTIEQPKALVEIMSKIEKSIDNFLSGIKSTLSKLTAKPDKESPKKSSAKHQAVKPKSPKAARTIKSDMPKAVREQENEPLFSVSKIKSDKYSPTSSKDKTVDRIKKNDLDL